MTAKEHLQTAYSIQKRIDRLETLRQSLRDELYSLNSPAGNMDKDKVQTSMSGDTMLRLIAKVDEVERDLIAEIERLTVAKRTILNEIERIPNENYKQLLFARYICCMRWEKIALDADKGIRWIYRMHGKALNAFEKVWK